uniref:cupin domain-containing protein n=1 Tax=Acinetobacter baumannii TaxID=470 RepID=UPI001D0DD102
LDDLPSIQLIEKPKEAIVSDAKTTIEFPPHSRITYETNESSRVVQQQLWVVEGKIEIQLGETSYALGQGDCLAMQLDQPVIYSNHSAQVARYILVVSNQLVPALKESL